VVRGADEVTVTLADERELRAKFVGGDAKTDLAVLKIEASNLHPARLGNSDDMKVGQWVLAIGCPFGLEQTVTAGIISARGRVVGIIEGGYEDFLQTDAAINPGNSGGPLVNLQGEVIGINSAIESRTGGFMGIGFAIPTNLARNVMDSLIKDGKVVRGFLGATIQPLDEGLAGSFGFRGTKAVLIGNVFADSPAEKAGLREGDIVTELNGRAVETVSQLRNGIAALPPKSSAELTVFRDGKTQRIRVVVGELTGQEAELAQGSAERASSQELGITVVPLTRQLADQIGHTGELEGVVVTQVEPGSLAENADIRPGDIVMGVGDTAVTGMDGYREALRGFDPKQGARLQLVRDGIRLFVFVRSAG
jgi:serine protease Do